MRQAIYLLQQIFISFQPPCSGEVEMLSCAAHLPDKNPVERKAPGGSASQDADE
jgi:hypothetical protein